MAIIRFGISRTDEEWKLLKTVISKSGKYKPQSINYFINQEINRLFKGRKINCHKIRAHRTNKDFQINVPDDVAEHLECEANRLGIKIGELIAKRAVDPHIPPINPSTT